MSRTPDEHWVFLWTQLAEAHAVAATHNESMCLWAHTNALLVKGLSSNGEEASEGFDGIAEGKSSAWTVNIRRNLAARRRAIAAHKRMMSKRLP